MEKDLETNPEKVEKLPKGLLLEMPRSILAPMRVRSGLASKGMILPNGLVLIDSDNKGEIMVLLLSL